LTGADKDDAADDLGKLAEEITKPEPRIKRLFDGIKQLAPDDSLDPRLGGAARRAGSRDNRAEASQVTR
jgi:hypothetical protein